MTPPRQRPAFGDIPTLVPDSERAAARGLVFKLSYQGRAHDVLVPRKALEALCDSFDPKLDLRQAFRDRSARILGVASRLLRANSGVSPIVLNVELFFPQHAIRA
jgi:hypothetical protein